MKKHIRNLFVALALMAAVYQAAAQGTAFSYQGKLNDGGNPANGIYDVRFTVCDALTNGANIAGPITNTATGVSNGLFAVTLDFGGGVFTGSARWLQVDVRTNGNGAFTTLSPREPLLPVPYAITASSASNLLGTLPAAQLPGSVLTNTAGGVTLSGTFSGNGSGLISLNPANLGAGTAGISITGNAASATTAANVTGNISDSQLSPNIARLNGTNNFTGTNNFQGVTVATNANNVFNGSFTGNGTGLTNLTSGVPSGAIVLSQTSSNGLLSASGFTPLVTPPGVTWTPATNAAPWIGGYLFPAVSFNGQMWVLGNGQSSSAVWSSPDGTNWTQITNTSPWGGGTLPASAVVFSGKIWLFGYGVWSSSDGTNWTQVTNATPWNAPARRYGFSTLAFNGKLWVLGGETNTVSGNFYNDVWSSPDGANWTQATNSAQWTPRWGHTSAVFNGLMWVMGGCSYYTTGLLNDIWSSPDGLNWTRATPAAQWAARDRFASVVLNGQLFVLGGQSVSSGGNTNDTWSSSDGTNWTSATSAASWTPRFGLAALTLNGKMWVLGGYSDFSPNYNNDVWFSQTNTNMLGSYYLFQKQ